MKRTIVFMLIAAMLATLFMTACKKPDDTVIDVDPKNTDQVAPTSSQPGDDTTEIPGTPEITDGHGTDQPTDMQTPGENDTAAPTSVPFVTDGPTFTDAPVTDAPGPVTPTDPTPDPGATNPSTGIPVPTIAPTSAPTGAPGGHADYSVFDNCCFVGNSVFEGLHLYGVIQNGAWYTKVGLNILTVYNTPVTGGSVPIIDELNNGSYSGILLMFGQNECGWPDLNNFIHKYEQLLQDVWAKQPNAKLFLMGITPVSASVSAVGNNGVTNPNINTINAGLQALAERTQNAYYVSVPQQFYNSDGSLKEEASTDGIHLTKAYMQIWADHICNTVSAAM